MFKELTKVNNEIIGVIKDTSGKPMSVGSTLIQFNEIKALNRLRSVIDYYEKAFTKATEGEVWKAPFSHEQEVLQTELVAITMGYINAVYVLHKHMEATVERLNNSLVAYGLDNYKIDESPSVGLIELLIKYRMKVTAHTAYSDPRSSGSSVDNESNLQSSLLVFNTLGGASPSQFTFGGVNLILDGVGITQSYPPMGFQFQVEQRKVTQYFDEYEKLIVGKLQIIQARLPYSRVIPISIHGTTANGTIELKLR